MNLRKQRFDAGALRLDKLKLQFALDKDTGLPCGFSVYQQKDSNRFRSHQAQIFIMLNLLLTDLSKNSCYLRTCQSHTESTSTSLIKLYFDAILHLNLEC